MAETPEETPETTEETAATEAEATEAAVTEEAPKEEAKPAAATRRERLEERRAGRRKPRGQTTPECPGCHGTSLERAFSTFAVSSNGRAAAQSAPGPCGTRGPAFHISYIRAAYR